MNNIIQSLENTFLKSATIGNRTNDKNIQRHILYSLSNRIRIIKHNYEYLDKEGYLNEMEQINDDIYPILNTHLNSIYIHISGGLDNLAWSFCYRSNIFGEIDENTSKCRNKVGLKNSKFIEALKIDYFKLYTYLKEKKSWLLELKNLRDPIAHREILLVSRIYSEEESKRKNDLEKELNKLVNNLHEVNLNKIETFTKQVEKLQDDIDLLGSYSPVFCTSPNPKSVLSIKNQIETDIINFIHITDKIIDTMVQKEKE